MAEVANDQRSSTVDADADADRLVQDELLVQGDRLVQDERRRELARQADRRASWALAARQVALFAAMVVLLACLYAGYKSLGQAIGDGQTGWPIVGSVLPATDDLTMPPLLDIVTAFGDRAPGGAGGNLAVHLLERSLFTLREAAVGFALGAAVGLAIAILLARWKALEDGLLPLVIASQTIPLIAIAPIVVIWGRNNVDFFPWQWQDWMSVSIIATYLTFFPVAVNGLRGLQSAEPEHIELMDSYAASWFQSLWRLRLPAAVPHLFAALKIAATASIVGAIVGEISAGVEGGLGRRILGDALNYTAAPARLYASVIGAAVLGIAVFGLIIGGEKWFLSRQGREAVQ